MLDIFVYILKQSAAIPQKSTIFEMVSNYGSD